MTFWKSKVGRERTRRFMACMRTRNEKPVEPRMQLLRDRNVGMTQLLENYFGKWDELRGQDVTYVWNNRWIVCMKERNAPWSDNTIMNLILFSCLKKKNDGRMKKTVVFSEPTFSSMFPAFFPNSLKSCDSWRISRRKMRNKFAVTELARVKREEQRRVEQRREEQRREMESPCRTPISIQACLRRCISVSLSPPRSATWPYILLSYPRTILQPSCPAIHLSANIDRGPFQDITPKKCYIFQRNK